MKWPDVLHEAIFLKRYKRFFADILIEGSVEVAHVANTGSLRSCLHQNQRCWVSKASDPKRKLKYSLQAVETESGAKIGVNTSLPNALVREAFDAKIIPWWGSFDQVRSEVAISKETRLDLCLSNSQNKKKHWIEVKNVTYAEGNVACFPDAVTERGLKHIHELVHLLGPDSTCELVFTVQRDDVQAFAPARQIDPAYSQALEWAYQKGVKISPLMVHLDTKGIHLTQESLELKWH